MEKDYSLFIAADVDSFLTFTEQESPIEVIYFNKNVWMNQKTLCQYFNVAASTVNYQLRQVFAEKVLNIDENRKYFRVISLEGENQVVRKQAFYNLEVIIAVSFRFRTRKAIMFARNIVKKSKNLFLTGFAIEKNNLTNGRFVDEDYYKKLKKEVNKIFAGEEEKAC